MKSRCTFLEPPLPAYSASSTHCSSPKPQFSSTSRSPSAPPSESPPIQKPRAPSHIKFSTLLNSKPSNCIPVSKSSRELSDTRHHSRAFLKKKQTACSLSPSFLSPAAVLSQSGAFLMQYEKSEIASYKKVYYFGQNAIKVKGVHFDKAGNYIIRTHDHLAYRYEIIEILGKGKIGDVVMCLDHKVKEKKALKIIRHNSSCQKSAENEYNILKMLTERPDEENNIIRVGKKFMFRGHLIIELELLGCDLYQFALRTNHKPQGANFAKRVATQILLALKHIHQNNLVHCDLRPDNILLKNTRKSNIRVIDFTSACFRSESNEILPSNGTISAPEVLLQFKITEKVDIWCLGCIIFELLTGSRLFQTETDKEIIAKTVSLLGFPPLSITAKAKNLEIIALKSLKSLPKTPLRLLLSGFDSAIIDFTEKCLRWDPDARISASEGLNSLWIKGRHRGTSTN